MKGLRVVLGVLLWVLVLGTSSTLVSLGSMRGLISASSWLSAGTAVQGLILATSVALILILSRGNPGPYGFKMPTVSAVRAALVYGSFIAVFVHVALAVLWRMLPPSEGHPALPGSSLLRVVLTVYILASISEEVLHRGLVQTFLEPVKVYGVAVFRARIGAPAIIAAALFGASHIMLLTTGAEGRLVAGIVASATVLGLVAGYYREKSGSLVPAILVHMLFNAYGGVSEYIQNLL